MFNNHKQNSSVYACDLDISKLFTMFALVCWVPGAWEPVLGVRVAGQWFAWVPGFPVLVFFALGGWRIGAGLVNPF